MKLYNSIDVLPIWNYYKIIESGDLKYLAITNNYGKDFNYDQKSALIFWEYINDEYIDFFGVSREMVEILELQAEVAINRYEWTVNKTPVCKSLWKQAEKKLDMLLNGDETNEGVLQKQIFYIEKEMGFSIDEKQVSVKRFFSYIKELNEYANRLKQSKNGKEA